MVYADTMAQVQSQFGAAAQLCLSFLTRHPFWSIIPAFALACVSVRLATEIRFRRQRYIASRGGVLTTPICPYWIPWVGHGASFALGAVPYLQSISRQLGSKTVVFALSMGKSKHNVILSPSIAKQVINDRKSPVNMDAWTYYVFRHVFQDGGDLEAMHPHAIKGPIVQPVHDMVKNAFVEKAIQALVTEVEQKALGLISGKPPAELPSWELSSKVKMLEVEPRIVAEVSLHPLMRDFTSDLMVRVLLGESFRRNNPNAVKDVWAMDERIMAFMAKVPDWMPMVSEAAQARKRLVAGLTAFHDAYTLYLAGQDPGPEWGDMSDVSTVIHDRALAWNASSEKTTVAGNGAMLLSLLWLTNVNANQIIFWVVFYAFADPSLLAELREEIAPYVHCGDVDGSLKIDIDGLWRKCPLLKGAVFETLRLEVSGVSVKYVEQDFVLHESEEDAAFLGKSGPESFLVKKDELIWVPHALHQLDEKYWPDPNRFDARRFWETDGDKEKASPSDVKVVYKTMKVWGGGEKVCKGKTFAEREICLVAAPIIMAYDIEPVNGIWAHPGRTPGSASSKPIRDFRVRIRKREGY